MLQIRIAQHNSYRQFVSLPGLRDHVPSAHILVGPYEEAHSLLFPAPRPHRYTPQALLLPSWPLVLRLFVFANSLWVNAVDHALSSTCRSLKARNTKKKKEEEEKEGKEACLSLAAWSDVGGRCLASNLLAARSSARNHLQVLGHSCVRDWHEETLV
ncbi:uncharacterized protein LY79DRAFT_401866 [Colletotrichum navitas]|uniref:Uncharacterized protein n=1 Tax=Colletotrichum navitas TaxID=681940 RepID=A0AAD8V0U1_9PEZI|nr:uncharacterized protein LY79DRAFT_401866 [Colletotrichum navitas]KAK1573614.1 hypothetical protein LY79DRAFT_401866 [Colletotrichum navitas]